MSWQRRLRPASATSDPPAGQRSSRRGLLGAAAGALGGSTVVELSGCGSHRNHVNTDAQVSRRDIALLNGLLDLELKTIAAYEAGIPLLDSASAKAAKQFLAQESSHAGELVGLIKKGHGVAVKPRLYDLGHPRDGGQVLELLHGLERAQLAAYLTTVPHLSGGTVRAAMASVFANDAQHVAVLRGRLGLASPAPAALVTASE